MKQVIQESVEKLRKAVENEKNVFVKCRSFSEFEAIKEIIFKRQESYPHALDTRGVLPFFPCYIRIGNGEVKEAIPEDEMKGISLYNGEISGFVENELIGGHSWKYCGAFEKRYNVGAKELAEDFALYNSGENPYVKCFECGRSFEDDETPYQGAFSDRHGAHFRCICKQCAYTLSVKVTDYEVKDGEVEVKEWVK